VDARDAGVLPKDLRAMVQVDDLIVLGLGEAVARIRTQVVRIKTSPPKEIPEPNHREEILERSHRLYYRPAHQVKRMLARRGRRWDEPFTPLTEAAARPGERKEFEYDQLN